MSMRILDVIYTGQKNILSYLLSKYRTALNISITCVGDTHELTLVYCKYVRNTHESTILYY